MTGLSYTDQLVSRWRIGVLLILATAGVLTLAGRLVDLQVLQHDRYQVLARSQHWSADTIPARRGSIYLQDLSSGTQFPVAVSAERSLVYAVPRQLKDTKGTARELDGILGVSPDSIEEKFSYNPNYVILARRLEQATAEQVEKADLPGIHLQSEHVRIYPEGPLAASVIGFADTDLVGQYGLERSFESILGGEPGYLAAEKDTGGVPIVSGGTAGKPPRDGADLTLTIDRNIQQAAEEALALYVKKYRAERGTVAVMDPKSGDVLAMASYPSYDPGRYSEVQDYNLFGNPAVDSPYEPGSVFKLVTMAAGIDTGTIRPDTKFIDTGQVTIAGHTIQNADRKAHGEVDMSYVLARSLNVGTIHALEKIGEKSFYDYVKRFGFGARTGIEFDNEATGLLLPQRDYSKLDMASLSFGQAITVTPMQLMVATGAVANGGKMVQPHIVSRISHADGKTEERKIRVTREAVSPESAAVLTAMLVNAVENGWGKPARVPGYTVAGKTGTAQIPRKDGKGYEQDATIGSFMGFAPAEDPRFVMVTRLDRPKGVSFSEEPAAHLWRDIAAFMLNYFQVAPTKPIP